MKSRYVYSVDLTVENYLDILSTLEKLLHQ